jgi:hypothetical protein
MPKLSPLRASAVPDWSGGVPSLELDPDDGACAPRSAAPGRDARQCPYCRPQDLEDSDEQSALAGWIGALTTIARYIPKSFAISVGRNG